MSTVCYLLIPLAAVGLAAIFFGAYVAAVLLVEAWKR
jgi:hypothetical protein